MKFTVDATEAAPVRLGLGKLERLVQALRLFLMTPKGSVPLARTIGTDWSIVDTPMGNMLPVLIGRIGRDIETHFPMLRVAGVRMAQVSADEAMSGIAKPVVTVELREEYINEYRSL